MIIRLTLALMLLCVIPAARATEETVTAFDFQCLSITGEPFTRSDFADRVMLVVNTASHCGFTRQPQRSSGNLGSQSRKRLRLSGVPSNDFGEQEPGTEAEIKDFCEVNFSIDLAMTSKAHGRGVDAHPNLLLQRKHRELKEGERK